MIALSKTLKQDCYSPRPGIEETIQWLLELGLPPLPIAPYHAPMLGRYYNIAQRRQPPEAKFTGKGPSYLNSQGIPILVAHSQYRSTMPDQETLRYWFQNRRTGIATMGGWQNVVWVDVDSKLYGSTAECQAEVETWLSRYGLHNTYYERTQAGGYHVALQVRKLETVTFTRFAFRLEPDQSGQAEPQYRGELLGPHSTVVLAPTLGIGGRYVCLNRVRPMRVASLKSVGIVALRPPVAAGDSAQPFSSFCSETTALRRRYSGQQFLNHLLSRDVQDLLRCCHQVEAGGRSDNLTKIAREAIGWQNWLLAKGYPEPLPDARTLIHQAGQRMGLDQGRIERVIQSASQGRPVLHSTPAIYSIGGDPACWRVVRRRGRHLQ